MHPCRDLLIMEDDVWEVILFSVEINDITFLEEHFFNSRMVSIGKDVLE